METFSLGGGSQAWDKSTMPGLSGLAKLRLASTTSRPLLLFTKSQDAVQRFQQAQVQINPIQNGSCACPPTTRLGSIRTCSSSGTGQQPPPPARQLHRPPKICRALLLPPRPQYSPDAPASVPAIGSNLRRCRSSIGGNRHRIFIAPTLARRCCRSSLSVSCRRSCTTCAVKVNNNNNLTSISAPSRAGAYGTNLPRASSEALRQPSHLRQQQRRQQAFIGAVSTAALLPRLPTVASPPRPSRNHPP